MPLASGTHLGPYEIVSPLGAGGMGEVYVARDSRLNRSVAIKVLPSEISADAGRRARFEREARAIASLSHAHICTVYDVGDHEGVAFLVMERLEGKTLAERLTRGPLPLSEAILCASQVAEGLECAHAAGIVHRDLKPANVMLTKAGAKLLDFGLATPSPVGPSAGAATVTGPLTMKGTILGTLPYMAPEQLEGKPVDARADIFSFGAMVHEMVTGRRAFPESSEAGLIGAILHSHPPALGAAKPGTPPALERLVSVCLAKEPAGRWSSAHDVLLQLQGIAETGAVEGPAATAPRRSRERLAWAAAAIALLTAIGLGALFAAQRGQPDDAEIDHHLERDVRVGPCLIPAEHDAAGAAIRSGHAPAERIASRDCRKRRLQPCDLSGAGVVVTDGRHRIPGCVARGRACVVRSVGYSVIQRSAAGRIQLIVHDARRHPDRL